jgi:hypothetical protein
MTWDYFRLRCYTEGLAKAKITALAGVKDGLASERTYTTRTLPSGVVRGMRDFVTRGDVNGIRRSCALVGGLALTTVGYLRGRIAARQTPPRPGTSVAHAA